MGTELNHRWESGTLAHGVSDPFGQGPLPWLRSADHYLADGAMPWYVSVDAPGQQPLTVPRPASPVNTPANADDVAQQIKGFASAGVVRPGGSVDFRVTVNPPREFTVDVYRIGHYGGDGARQTASSPLLSGLVQPAPLVVGRTVSCHHWWQSWRLHVPAHWQPGAYVAVLTTADNRHRSHVPFTVRDADPQQTADLLLVLPDVTWQAYNLFPEDGRSGASLYHAWDGGGRLVGSPRRPSPSPSTGRTPVPDCPCTSGTRTTSSAGPSGTATTSPTPPPPTCTPGWSNRTGTGR